MILEDLDQLKNMNPYQYIKNAWRSVDGSLKLVEINYEDLDWPNGYDHHLKGLKNTILEKGTAYGAFDEKSKLIGFVTLNAQVYTNSYEYVLLDQLFISLEHRNKGIGKALFNLCVMEARRWGVDKIYICAGSAEETIAFYKKIGCLQTSEINQVLYEEDPRDLQLEYCL
jgi:GNAT superfamily N-acetyltransferase